MDQRSSPVDKAIQKVDLINETSGKSLVSFSAMNTFRTHIPDGFELPERLARLSELAFNLWWTWQPEAVRLFGRLDYDLWERLGHNPIRLLREIERQRLNQAAQDQEYLALFDRIFTWPVRYFEPFPAGPLLCR